MASSRRSTGCGFGDDAPGFSGAGSVDTATVNVSEFCMWFVFSSAYSHLHDKKWLSDSGRDILTLGATLRTMIPVQRAM